MSEPNEPTEDPGPVEEPEFSGAREAEMAELSRRADLVEETAPPDDGDGEQ